MCCAASGVCWLAGLHAACWGPHLCRHVPRSRLTAAQSLLALSPSSSSACRALATVLLVAVPPLLVAYLQGLSPLPEERRLDALPGDVGSGEPTSPHLTSAQPASMVCSAAHALGTPVTVTTACCSLDSAASLPCLPCPPACLQWGAAMRTRSALCCWWSSCTRQTLRCCWRQPRRCWSWQRCVWGGGLPA